MIEVVPFSEQHQAGVVDVILPIQQREFGIPITLEAQPDLLDIPGFYQKGNGNFWVALQGTEVVGTISLLDIGNGQSALRKMFVKEPFRGAAHSVARRLLDALLQWCAMRRVREIFLGTTAQFLAAHRFYEKHGFTEIPRSDLPPAFPVMSVDTKFYKLELFELTLEGDHRICFVGDSFVQGTCDPEYRGWVGRVSSAARAAGFDVTAYNLGVRRNTSGDVLVRWQAECAARLPTHCSPYVVFSFGANDMTEEQGRLRVDENESIGNFEAIVSKARERYTVITIGPVSVGDTAQDERILRLCARYAQRASALGVPYLPLASALVDDSLWRSEIKANDGTHPGAAGYELIASRVLAWSSWWFRSNSTGKSC